MPIRNCVFENQEFYHIVKRGVEGREIFLDDGDNLRFTNSLLVFNDTKAAPWNMRGFWYQRDPTSLADYYPENPFVEIHAFALMKNHFHLLLLQLQDKGIINFMKKMGGYAYYFNKKYKRHGPLFESRFRAVHINTEVQLKNVFSYIHTNPIGLIASDWKEKGISDPIKGKEFLKDFRWSSYLDFIGRDNFPSLIKKDFYVKLFGGEKECQMEVENWIETKAGWNEARQPGSLINGILE